MKKAARRNRGGAPPCITDVQVKAAIVRGDARGLAAAYRDLAGEVHAIASALCGTKRAPTLTQEIFLQLWNEPQRFDVANASLRSCVLMHAHERAVGDLRSRAASSQPERAAINELIAALPAEERRPIVLAHFGGLTSREIATLLGVPVAQIKSLIRSGLHRLRADGAQHLGGATPISTSESPAVPRARRDR